MKIDIMKYILISAITIIMIGGIVSAGTMITDRVTKTIPEEKVIAVLEDVTAENYEDKMVEKGVQTSERETMLQIRMKLSQAFQKCLQDNNITHMEECTTAINVVNAKYDPKGDTKDGLEVVEEIVG